jgi:hypothetical protein
VKLDGEPHLTTWRHAVVPSAPANLVAQISPPPATAPPNVLNGSTPPTGQIDATGQPPGL